LALLLLWAVQYSSDVDDLVVSNALIINRREEERRSEKEEALRRDRESGM
jgi:hypothetical protein